MTGGVDADFHVVVVGAGNAALCAALSTREQGGDVVVLENAARSAQGGNCPYAAATSGSCTTAWTTCEDFCRTCRTPMGRS